MRITDKTGEIEDYLAELEGFMPGSFKEYERDAKTKAACERYFEKIIEAVVDLAYLVIKDKGLKIPDDDKGVFDILAEAELITESLASKLKDAKGMRNIISHEYGTVDDEIVFNSITEDLVMDVHEFLKSLRAD